MKILNFGSLNVDKVYTMHHFVKPGETISSLKYEVFCGGKGLNQSIALAMAGAEVYHAGKVGADGEILTKRLKAAGVDITHISTVTDTPTGHAVIQVEATGQNCIILFGGANRAITFADADKVFEMFSEGDILLLQNEISSLQYILQKAKEKKMTIIVNPSPVDETLLEMDLSMVDYFIMNEIEGHAFTQKEEAKSICEAMQKKYSRCKVALTLGKRGVMYSDAVQSISCEAYKVKVIDTTAAGDTFTGYFIAGLVEGAQMENILQTACKAAAIAVGRNGAADSIPTMEEVRGFSL